MQGVAEVQELFLAMEFELVQKRSIGSSAGSRYVRVVDIQPGSQEDHAPICVGGRGAARPEFWGGPTGLSIDAEAAAGGRYLNRKSDRILTLK